jgi:hypothetical protein
MSDDDLITVEIRGFPLALWEVSRGHIEALLREFAFIADGGGDNAELPHRLLDIVENVRIRAGGLNAQAERSIEEATARGDADLDFDVLVPAGIARGAPRFAALLDEVDEYCRAGDLLTLATPPDVRAFQLWYIGEFARQVDGGAPLAWRDARPTTR